MLVATRLYSRRWEYRPTVHRPGCRRIPRFAKLFPPVGGEQACPHCIKLV